METNKNSVEYEKTYTAAIRALGLRIHACRELSRKLHEKGYSEKNIAPVIAELLELGYLNDVEYAKSYIGLSYDKLKGKRRIEKELAEKGVSTSDIALAFEEYLNEHDTAMDSEIERATLLAEKGMALLTIKVDLTDKASIYAEKKRIREKLTRKLLAKGFSMDITYKAVESVLKINTDSWQN